MERFADRDFIIEEMRYMGLPEEDIEILVGLWDEGFIELFFDEDGLSFYVTEYGEKKIRESGWRNRMNYFWFKFKARLRSAFARR